MNTFNKDLEKYNTSELIIENIKKFSVNDLGLCFNSFVITRDIAIKNNDLEKARSEQSKIAALFADGRLDNIFMENEFGFSRIGNIEQIIRDREVIFPLILR
jgi:hypothetical protein